MWQLGGNAPVLAEAFDDLLVALAPLAPGSQLLWETVEGENELNIMHEHCVSHSLLQFLKVELFVA